MAAMTEFIVVHDLTFGDYSISQGHSVGNLYAQLAIGGLSSDSS